MLNVIQIALFLATLVMGLGGSSAPKHNSDVNIGPGGVPTCDGTNCPGR